MVARERDRPDLPQEWLERATELKEALVAAFMSGDSVAWRATNVLLAEHVRKQRPPPTPSRRGHPIVGTNGHLFQMLLVRVRSSARSRGESAICPCLRWRLKDTHEKRVGRMRLCGDQCAIRDEFKERMAAGWADYEKVLAGP